MIYLGILIVLTILYYLIEVYDKVEFILEKYKKIFILLFLILLGYLLFL
jgi:hypothetical protein